MNNSPSDGYAPVSPVPVVNELERLVVYILFDADSHVQLVPEVSSVRQRF